MLQDQSPNSNVSCICNECQQLLRRTIWTLTWCRVMTWWFQMIGLKSSDTTGKCLVCANAISFTEIPFSFIISGCQKKTHQKISQNLCKKMYMKDWSLKGKNKLRLKSLPLPSVYMCDSRSGKKHSAFPTYFFCSQF